MRLPLKTWRDTNYVLYKKYEMIVIKKESINMLDIHPLNMTLMEFPPKQPLKWSTTENYRWDHIEKTLNCFYMDNFKMSNCWVTTRIVTRENLYGMQAQNIITVIMMIIKCRIFSWYFNFKIWSQSIIIILIYSKFS